MPLMKRATPGPTMHGSRDSRRRRARTLAAFFAAGALCSTIAILVPGWDQMHRPGIAVTVAMAAGGSLMLLVWAEHIRRWVCHGFIATGTLLISACQVLAGGGSATATYGMLYIWVVLHSALFFRTRAVVAHLALTTLAHVVALVWLDEVAAMAPQLAVTLGTQVAAALVVGSLTTRMRQLADTDSLTGLGNRRVVERSLAWALARSGRRPSTPTWLGVLDLDLFKEFNDEHGHAAGDQILVEAADAWRRLLRPADVLARTGGDEFTVILTDCDAAQAEGILRRMTAAAPSGVACSAGLARWDGHESPNRLIERADAALYTAKVTGPVVVAPILPQAGAPHTA